MHATRRIRVLFVDHETRLSGGQQDLVDLVEALDPARIEAHVALPGGGALAARVERAGAIVHLLPMRDRLRSVSRWELARSPLRAAAAAGDAAAVSVRLARLLRRLRPDVVHTNSLKAHLLAAAPALLTRTPLVWHVRDILESGWPRTAFRAAAAWVPTRILCLSNAAAGPFDRGRARRKVRVVYNGIHLSRFGDPPREEVRRALGGDNGEILVGLVGQIAHWKGQDVFVEAAGRLAGSHPRARFVLIGECLYPGNENGYLRSLRAQGARLESEGRLVWTGWTDDIPATMGALDVVVHTSRLPEPFGRVIVEAMAAGRPVVASSAGAAPEILPPGAGRIVPPGDAQALADALAPLLGDEQHRRSTGEAARRASARFDIARTAAGVTAVYEEVVRCA